MEIWSSKPRLRALLDHLARIKDTRQSWRVAYPLREVLVVCGTIASGNDYDDIVDWGKAHLSYHGIPCADWLRTGCCAYAPVMTSCNRTRDLSRECSNN